ncbi:MAG TPA: low affinity iron permease family protein [Caulobacteraceae bacterium]
MEEVFEKAANAISRATGRPAAFILCALVVIVWAISGPFFHYSDTWQLVINTGTTIVTFLMVFLIQNSQNREGEALQGKLDELIRALETAQNRFIGLERHSEAEIGEMRTECETEAKPKSATKPARRSTSRRRKSAAA